MNERDVLQYAIAQGIISVDAIQAQVKMYERQRFLEMHKNEIWQGKNGKWYTKLPATETAPKKLVKKTNREDLEEEIINFYKTIEERPIFKKVYEEWLQAKQEWNEISQGTVDRYKIDFTRYFEGTDLAGKRVDLITDDYLEDFIKKTIAQHELTAKAYSNMKTLLLGVMKHAKKKKYTNYSISSFFGDLQLSKKTFKTPKKKKQVFTDEEAKKIIKYMQQNPTVEHMGILLVFQTGIREGELAALKYSDIENNTLHIQRQEIRYKGEPGSAIYEVVEYTKTAAGDRYIILTDQALKTIKQLRKLNPFGPYMMQKGDTRVHKQLFNDKLYSACKHCKIEPMSMHKIRKTYATKLINAGTDDSTIMEQMGHSDINTTMRYYYFSDKDQEEKAEQVKRAINY